MHIYDLLDIDELREAIDNKHVRAQYHPTEPLAILNYSDTCAYEGAWSDTTLQCRGLIYNTTDGEVVARPFPKFFNYGQTGAAEIPLDAAVSVTDKVDGSLAVIFRRPSDGELAVATRGSFTSDQAIKATELLHTDRYKAFRECGMHADTTYLAEIIYPANRIVLDYGSREDLVLLGSVDIPSGVIDEPAVAAGFGAWPPDLVTETFSYRTLAEALAAPPRENVEGYVVRRVTGRLGAGLGDTIKIKTESYVRLHKLVTGLSERTIWEQIVAGATLQEITEPLPDEFHDWVLEVYARLNAQVGKRRFDLGAAFHRAVSQLGPESATDPRHLKKEFAMLVKDDPDAWALFALYEGKDIRAKLWEQAKPDAFLTPSGRTYTEEAA